MGKKAINNTTKNKGKVLMAMQLLPSDLRTEQSFNLLGLNKFSMFDEILSCVSTKEIQSIKKRIDFYLKHYEAVKRKNDINYYESKIQFLANLNKLLEDEIKNRNTCNSD